MLNGSFDELSPEPPVMKISRPRKNSPILGSSLLSMVSCFGFWLNAQLRRNDWSNGIKTILRSHVHVHCHMPTSANDEKDFEYYRLRVIVAFLLTLWLLPLNLVDLNVICISNVRCSLSTHAIAMTNIYFRIEYRVRRKIHPFPFIRRAIDPIKTYKSKCKLLFLHFRLFLSFPFLAATTNPNALVDVRT